MSVKTLYLTSTATAAPFTTTSRLLSELANASEVTLGPGEFDSGIPGNPDAGQWNPNSPIADTTAATEISINAAGLSSTRQGWLWNQDLTGQTLVAGTWSFQLRLRANQGTATETGRILVRVTIVTGSGSAYTTVKNLFTTSITGEASHAVGQEGWRAQNEARIGPSATAANFSVTVGDSGTAQSHTFAANERILVELGFCDADSTTDRTWRLDYNTSNSFITTPDISPPTGSGDGALSTFAGSGAGAETIAGSGDGALSAFAGSGTAAEAFTGSGDGAMSTFAGSGTGNHEEPSDEVDGSGGGALSAFAGSGTGTESFTGSGDGVLASFAGSGTAAETFAGSGDGALATFAGSGAGAETIAGSGTGALSIFAGSGTGTETIPGNGTGALSAFAGSGTGLETFAGTGSGELAAFQGSGTGAEAFTGSGTGALSQFAGSGVGTHGDETFGLGDGALASFASAGTSLLSFLATALGSLQSFDALGSASVVDDGDDEPAPLAAGRVVTSRSNNSVFTTDGIGVATTRRSHNSVS